MGPTYKGPSQLLVGGMFEGINAYPAPLHTKAPRHVPELHTWRKVLTRFGTAVAFCLSRIAFSSQRPASVWVVFFAVRPRLCPFEFLGETRSDPGKITAVNYAFGRPGIPAFFFLEAELMRVWTWRTVGLIAALETWIIARCLRGFWR